MSSKQVDEVNDMSADVVVRPQMGEILATDVSFEEFLERFAGMHCELVDGNVIKMAPASLQHQDLLGYVYLLLGWYFDYRPVGRVIQQPFVQKLAGEQPKREPDLLVVLNENLPRLNDTFLDGPADICIEISSPGTVDIDRGDKFVEYEQGGVPEYWIFDSRRREALFNRLNADGVYELQRTDTHGNYQTPLLPGLIVHVPNLWLVPLPGPAAIMQAVQTMLK
jgi:Uma2 family endonuclease